MFPPLIRHHAGRETVHPEPVQQQFNANPESLHPDDDPERKGGGDARPRARKREDEEHKQQPQRKP